MIKAYLAGISSHYEGEDIEIRYRIFEDQELISKNTVYHHYVKPAIVGQVALITLLKELEKYKGRDITIIINDAALNEQIRGTSQTKNRDVLKMSRTTRDELRKFENTITFKDVSGDPIELTKWDDILQP